MDKAVTAARCEAAAPVRGAIGRFAAAVRVLGVGLTRAWLQRRGDEFTAAYAQGISQRMPLFYLVAVFNTLLVGWCCRHAAPTMLVLSGAVFGLFGLMRAYHWLPASVAARSLQEQRRDLDRMAMTASLVGFLYVTWNLALYLYGDAEQKALIQFVLAVTMLAGILGMGHSPRTSMALAASYLLPTTAVFIAWGGPGALYEVFVELAVAAILLLVAERQHSDFVRLELSRQMLVRRERQAERLASARLRQATVDPLTGGLNRRGILDQVEKVLGSDAAAERPWLVLADLDGFKHINDTYGHAAGDAVLRAVRERISAEPGVLAQGRLGGDEFAALFDGALDARGVEAACRRLSATINEPIAHNGTVLRIHVSIGVYRVGAVTVSGCLERADAALYKAKAIGGGAVCLFDQKDETALEQRVAITRQFSDCSLGARVRLLYQPLFDEREARIVGFEALARWSPDGVSWLAPGDFMSIAEATGRTGELTQEVLARALAECQPSARGVSLFVNLSPRDLLRDGAVETIAGVVAAAGESPSSIVLEVTEQALLADSRRTTAQLNHFRACGFRIALDDFGAGWSGLSHLRQLPLDFVKLDRELANALPEDPGARAVAGMIVALTWQLGIACSIEGVETQQQADAARDLGITMMQGFYFGRPEPAELALANIKAAVA